MKLGWQRRNSGKTGLPRAAGSDPAGPYQAQSAGQAGAQTAVATPSGKNMDGPVPPLALVPQDCLLGEAHPIGGKGGVGRGLEGQ